MNKTQRRIMEADMTLGIFCKGVLLTLAVWYIAAVAMFLTYGLLAVSSPILACLAVKEIVWDDLKQEAAAKEK